jgi:CRP-like cAMP-binding protein
MNEQFLQFQQFLAPYGLTGADFNQLIQSCEMVHFPKGEIIIRTGIKQNHIYFICKGLVRNYVFTDEGEIKTYGFRMENMTSTGYANYNYKEDLKAKVSVECLEPCEMIKIPISAIFSMVESSKVADKVGRFLAEIHVMELVDFIIDADTKSLLDRYNNLDTKFPNIHQRVPQHIIASYLRTTPVHLSRVKNATRKSLTNVNILR